MQGGPHAESRLLEETRTLALQCAGLHLAKRI